MSGGAWYVECLKDPRWLIKRAKILIRDNSTCQYCFAVEKKEPGTPRMLVWLEVHHFEYPPYGLPPWEAEDSDLITLCMTCHGSVMKSYDRIRKITGDREKERMERREAIRNTPDLTLQIESEIELIREIDSKRQRELAWACNCENCLKEQEAIAATRAEWEAVLLKHQAKTSLLSVGDES